jgi:hypothetical protein
MTEGTFNSFSAQDITRLNQKAKNYIRLQAQESDLLLTAVKQGNQALDMIKFMVEGMGWTVQYEQEMARPQDSLLK